MGERRVRNAKVTGSNPVVSSDITHAEIAVCDFLSFRQCG